ncbi:zinc finger HIT domain-containing protein 2 [Engraulis encrasicolus]|uniref:zinc finger HIT domain-containing protein 2 n=1 Tax=Engraulis encrasicolus TaxID=184585 RepID=UPI002FD1F2D6
MQPIVRRKLPSRLRCMLTDIGPKEEDPLDLETEEDPVEKDGIVLPRRGASNTSDLLAPAITNDTTNAGSMPQVCGLCLSQPYKYTCPRCNITYCSLACYRSPGHSGCSEEFYKESVFEELKNTGLTEKESREKMHDILLRLRKNEGQMENLTEQLGEEVEPGGPEALQLLSRLAEIQASGEENTEEVQNILLRLRDIDKGGDGSQVHGLLDEDDEEDDDDEDLADRLAGLDLDSLSEEELWALLGKEDREKFEQLVKGGAIGGLIPIWKPWWEAHDRPKELLLEVLSEEDTAHKQDELSVVPEDKRMKDSEGKGSKSERTEGATGGMSAKMTEDVKVKRGNKNKTTSKQKNIDHVEDTNMKGKNKPNSRVPPVNMSKIPPLLSLTKNPSPLLGNTLVNVLYGYTFSLCLFNGDLSEEEMTQDFCQMVLVVSEGLSTARVFSSPQEALEVAVMAVSAGGYFDREDPQAPARAVEAVAHVLSGQSSRDPVGYCLAALSELKATLAKARALLPKEGEGAELRKRYFQAAKKCEFLQSWAKENTQGVKILAAGVWREHLKRDNERRVLEVGKVEAEQSRRKGKGPLIEEMTTKKD